MFKLVTMTAPDEPKSESRPPTGETEKSPAAEQNTIPLLGFRKPAVKRPDAEDEIDDDTAHPESERDARSA